jgi:hypothetical protein
MIGPHLARVMTAARAADVAHLATGSGESDVRAKRYAGLSLVSRR